ncbi:MULTISPECIES: OmpH family outer membrane protein [unclassified Oceanobacter]|jgi:outer membrane protein|uniref:OmpH family outer membrane protein n=1 Tax=unclassified Oceanobacter TaxID=2620260 RepID=UPI0026E17AA0|nr:MULTISPECIES: OmpH family outer membrane protein [unclassified Oceanobacter]MDO6682814.1 OmpH family outer membrane protein [Oceanobacter sp. 5_MG-2023]MDP2504886.1 OmpH family outer membrane protein [Oceanobacter sp. 3_MG-2023]MDP2546330.1 OmpH family outer membrane protein [Oceanobacter sp. 4_MG-2023]MDP2607631.1 OmpH family outer membrane protein [Oceanobacter sp. 1_MG-2023]MDP2610899.1 OmpH family outer membrane protein [Oceanobacter sp. 2_MG-2023]
MRVFLFLVVALLSPLAAAELKVGVVDMERALFLSDEAKSAAKKFEQENSDSIGKVRDIEKSMLALKEKRETDGAIMSQAELAKLVTEYEAKAKERQFYLEKLQQQDQQWRQSFFRSKLPELEELLKALIDDGKYDLVLQAGAAVYSSPAIDLTKPLLERLNGK